MPGEQRLNIHRLKIAPEYFRAVMEERKTFEIRENDRDFKVGDQLILEEWDHQAGGYTGARVSRLVKYVSTYAQRSGVVVLGIADVGISEVARVRALDFFLDRTSKRVPEGFSVELAIHSGGAGVSLLRADGTRAPIEDPDLDYLELVDAAIRCAGDELQADALAEIHAQESDQDPRAELEQRLEKAKAELQKCRQDVFDAERQVLRAREDLRAREVDVQTVEVLIKIHDRKIHSAEQILEEDFEIIGRADGLADWVPFGSWIVKLKDSGKFAILDRLKGKAPVLWERAPGEPLRFPDQFEALGYYCERKGAC